jgi:hypothetical protein
MSEHEPQTPQPQERWSSRRIAEALGVPAQPTGEPQPEDRGSRYEVGAHTKLDVYPKDGYVRVMLPGAAIELIGQQPPSVGESSVIFKTALTGEQEQRELGLSVNRSGDVYFAYMPAEQPETASPTVSDTPAQAPEQAPAAPSTAKRESPEAPKRGRSSHPRAKDATPSGQQATTPERDPQVRFSGEVKGVSYREPKQPGKAPSLQLTVASQEGEEMRFTRVYTTKQRAQQYKDVAQIGDRVDIVGLAQQQTRKMSDGTERQETVVYALGIKKVNPEGTQP